MKIERYWNDFELRKKKKYSKDTRHVEAPLAHIIPGQNCDNGIGRE